MDIYERIEAKDLTEDLLMLSNVCGIEAVRQLLRHLGGITLYIPKITRLDVFIRDYLMEYRDKSLKQIAGELKVSEQYLRNMKKKYKI